MAAQPDEGLANLVELNTRMLGGGEVIDRRRMPGLYTLTHERYFCLLWMEKLSEINKSISSADNTNYI